MFYWIVLSVSIRISDSNEDRGRFNAFCAVVILETFVQPLSAYLFYTFINIFAG